MRILLIGLLLAAGVRSSPAASYEVTRVIEVGPAAWVPSGGSVKWSPDGTRLAYFANNYLMISDTLGNSREIVAIPDFYPIRAEWASDHEIAVNLEDMSRRSDSTLYRLVVYDINTAEETVFQECWYTPTSELPGNSYYKGPYLSLEGNAYYRLTRITGKTEGTALERRLSAQHHTETRSLSSGRVNPLQDDHAIRWQDDGLYKVSLGDGEPTRIGPKPFRQAGPFTDISADMSYVINGGHIIRLSDSTNILLDTVSFELPDSTFGCSFVYVSFNPTGPEVLFHQTCDGEEPYVVDRIGTFNYLTGDFTILDTVTGIRNSQAPAYAPNGRNIAFVAGSKAYIIWREER